MQGATSADLKIVRSHVHALSQCRKLIRALGLKAEVAADTAGSAAEVAQRGDTQRRRHRLGAGGQDLWPRLAQGEYRGRRPQHDALPRHGADAPQPAPNDGACVVTTFVFRVRNVPAALYKALGGFATNGINMTKLESYMVGGRFTATQFYADVEGHPDRPAARARARGAAASSPTR